MMKLIMIIFGIASAILVLSLCRASAMADQHMLLAFDKWLQEHPEEIQQLPAEEIT